MCKCDCVCVVLRFIRIPVVCPLGLPDMNKVMKRLEDIGQTLMQLSSELKQCVEDVRIVSARQFDRLEQDRASAILASVDGTVDTEQVSLHSVDETVSKKVNLLVLFILFVIT